MMLYFYSVFIWGHAFFIILNLFLSLQNSSLSGDAKKTTPASISLPKMKRKIGIALDAVLVWGKTIPDNYAEKSTVYKTIFKLMISHRGMKRVLTLRFFLHQKLRMKNMVHLLLPQPHRLIFLFRSNNQPVLYPALHNLLNQELIPLPNSTPLPLTLDLRHLLNWTPY